MKLRIASQGAGAMTQVFAVSDNGDEEMIQGVQKVTWEMNHPRGVAEVKLTVLGKFVQADLLAELEDRVEVEVK